MKAGNILELYRAVAPVVGHRSSAWMMLLMICEAETTGLSRSELAQLFKARRINASRTLKKWQGVGLIEAKTVPAVRTSGRSGRSGRPRVNFIATEKLFKLLRVEQAVAA